MAPPGWWIVPSLRDRQGMERCALRSRPAKHAASRRRGASTRRQGDAPLPSLHLRAHKWGSGGARRPPGLKRSFPGDAPAGAANTVNGAIEIIGDEQRAVRHGKDIHRSPNVVVVLDEAGNERFHRSECAIAVQLDDHDIAADLHSAVPGSMPREEHHVAILVAESVAGVKLQPKRGRMGSEQRDWLAELAARVPPTEFRIREIALVAVGIAEIVLAGLGNAIELVL